MTEQRDLEQEREELLCVIELALPEKLRESLQTTCQSPSEPSVILSKNEVGTEYADQR